MVSQRRAKAVFYKLPENFPQGTWGATSQIRLVPEIKTSLNLILVLTPTQSCTCVTEVINDVIYLKGSCPLISSLFSAAIINNIWVLIPVDYDPLCQSLNSYFLKFSYVLNSLHCMTCALLNKKVIIMIIL